MNQSWNVWLEIINTCIEQDKIPAKHSGLTNGRCGLILLYAQLYRLTGNTRFLDKLYKEADHIMDAVSDNYSLGYGVAGIAWTVRNLQDLSLFSGMNNWYAEVDPLLEIEYMKYIRENNIDYYEGAMGILFYFLDKEEYPVEKLTCLATAFCSHISALQKKEDWMECKYNRKENKYYQAINLGVPHGITGVLLILLLIKEKVIIDIDPLIEKVIKLILSFENADTHFCHFPLTYGEEKTPNQTYSTIGWCYGDLMTGYAIHKAGILLNCTDYVDYGMKIVEDTTRRDNRYKEKLVLCHGYPSLSHIYHHIYRKTKKDIFQNRSLYYKDQAIELFLLRYKKHQEGITDSFFEDSSLFVGYSGFFLSLLSWNNQHIDHWINCLLL